MGLLGEIKRTPKQWSDFLASEEQPITLEEYRAGCLARMLHLLIESTQAIQHTEGMVGAFDDLMGKTTPGYASNSEDRERIAREHQQRMTAERQKMLEDANNP